MTIRKVLVSAAMLATVTGGAWAADLPNTKGPPAFAPPPPPVFTWTGLYIGGQVGYLWGQASSYVEAYPGDVFILPANTLDDSGVVGGGHIGYNYQFSQFVVGIEGDVEGSSASGSVLQAVGTATGRLGIEGSVRGRVGWAWDRILIYGTGGVEFASIQNGFTNFAGVSDSDTVGRAGWTAGGGIEYAFDPNWSVRAEYRYTDYGRYDFPFYNSIPGYAARVHLTDNRVEAGFSYKFDLFGPPAPVIAKY